MSPVSEELSSNTLVNDINDDNSDANNVDDEPTDEEYPVLYVDINLGKDRVERLTVFEGEDPKKASIYHASIHILIHCYIYYTYFIK